MVNIHRMTVGRYSKETLQEAYVTRFLHEKRLQFVSVIRFTRAHRDGSRASETGTDQQ